MPASRLRARLGVGEDPEPAGLTGQDRLAGDADAGEADGGASERDGGGSSRQAGAASDVRRRRASGLDPEERKRRLGRETTPRHSRAPAEPLPEALSPLQRLKRKVLEQPPPEAPPPPSSPLKDLVHPGPGEAERKGRGGLPPRPGAGSAAIPDTSPPRAPADPAAALRERLGSNDTTVVRGRERGHFRQGYFRDAVCFECGASHQTNRSAKGLTCPSCGAKIDLEDVEINEPHGQLIRTRGNVAVLRNGVLSRGPVECRDFILQGRLECAVHCSDDFFVRGDADLPAPVSCRRFVVERRCRTQATERIQAEEAEILGTLEGDLYCTGAVIIGAQGHVIGHVTARSVKLETGGIMEGGISILPSAPAGDADGEGD